VTTAIVTTRQTETVSVSLNAIEIDDRKYEAERESRASRVAAYFTKVADLTVEITDDAHKMFADFAHLRKGDTIGGCATQEEWARKYTGRTARALRYMFDGGNKKRIADKPKKLFKTNRVAVEEGIARQEYARGLADGKKGIIPPNTSTDVSTFHVLRSTSGANKGQYFCGRGPSDLRKNKFDGEILIATKLGKPNAKRLKQVENFDAEYVRVEAVYTLTPVEKP